MRGSAQATSEDWDQTADLLVGGRLFHSRPIISLFQDSPRQSPNSKCAKPRSGRHGSRKEVHMFLVANYHQRFHQCVLRVSADSVCQTEAQHRGDIMWLSETFHPRGFFTSVRQLLWVKKGFISYSQTLLCRGHDIFLIKCHQGAPWFTPTHN